MYHTEIPIIFQISESKAVINDDYMSNMARKELNKENEKVED